MPHKKLQTYNNLYTTINQKPKKSIMKKTIYSITLLMASVFFMTSCSSDSSPNSALSQLFGVWSISDVQDQQGGTTNMQLELMTMPYAQYATTIGQTASTNVPTGALAYSKTTVTSTYIDPYGGYPSWGSSNIQYSESKTYIKEVGYFTVSNATGIDKLCLYPQARLRSDDGMTWYNDGSSSAVMTEYSYTVNANQLIFNLPDLTQQIWTKGHGGGTPAVNTIVGIWQINNMNQSGNSVNMQLELTSNLYTQYAPTINMPIPGGIPEGALAYVKTVVTTNGGGYDPWSGSSYGTKSYGKEIGYYLNSNVGGTNKLMLYSVINMTSTDGVSWTRDDSKPTTITEYTYVLRNNQLIFNLPDLTQQIWTRLR